MKNIIQKIVLIGIMLLGIIACNSTHQIVYAVSETEELIMILDEYKEDLGDIEQFRTVITRLYDDLNSAEKVDEELKAKLTEDVNDLAKIDGINPVILNVFDVEFKSQINNLTDETLPEMREEIRAIKEWADAQVTTEEPGETPDTNPESTPDTNPKPENKPEPNPSTSDDNSVVNKDIPKAGIRNTIIIIAILVIIIAIITKNKYGYFKDI